MHKSHPLSLYYEMIHVIVCYTFQKNLFVYFSAAGLPHARWVRPHKERRDRQQELRPDASGGGLHHRTLARQDLQSMLIQFFFSNFITLRPLETLLMLRKKGVS